MTGRSQNRRAVKSKKDQINMLFENQQNYCHFFLFPYSLLNNLVSPPVSCDGSLHVLSNSANERETTK